MRPTVVADRRCRPQDREGEGDRHLLRRETDPSSAREAQAKKVPVPWHSPAPRLESPATHMIHDNLPAAIEDLFARIIAIRDSL